jgi:hypothetical protein
METLLAELFPAGQKAPEKTETSNPGGKAYFAITASGGRTWCIVVLRCHGTLSPKKKRQA